jgi:hypothetical protein
LRIKTLWDIVAIYRNAVTIKDQLSEMLGRSPFDSDNFRSHPARLMRGASEGMWETVESALLHGADVNAFVLPHWRDDPAANEPSEFGHICGISNTANGFIPDDDGCMNAVMVAACHCNMVILKAILEHGADVNLQDRTGRTALICAAAQDYSEGVKMLLEAGAAVNICTNTGLTALRHAVASGADETAQLLLNYGADALFVGSNGDTVLAPVVDICHFGGDAVEVVASYGVPLDAVMPNGNTALLEALEGDDTAVALQLVKAGADLSATDGQGRTAMCKCAERYIASPWIGDANERHLSSLWVAGERTPVEFVFHPKIVACRRKVWVQDDGASPLRNLRMRTWNKREAAVKLWERVWAER